MLRRQKLLLGTLLLCPRIPSQTELVKWVFLMRQESSLSSERSLYDFVPYKYGPFSFTLYHDLDDLSRLGYIAVGENRISPSRSSDVKKMFESLPRVYRAGVRTILGSFGHFSQNALIDP